MFTGSVILLLVWLYVYSFGYMITGLVMFWLYCCWFGYVAIGFFMFTGLVIWLLV